jgi:hypothetical protein
LLYSSFEGERKAGIREHEAGLTIFHDLFRYMPEAISIDSGYSDELWVKDARFENISGPAITISNTENPRTEVNLEQIACHHVPIFVLLREPGQKIPGTGEDYLVQQSTYGLTLHAIDEIGKIASSFEAHAVLPALPPFGPNAIAARRLSIPG